MRALIQIVLTGLAVLLVARIVPGIHYEGDWLYLILTGVVVGLLNLTVKPLVTVLSLATFIKFYYLYKTKAVPTDDEALESITICPFPDDLKDDETIKRDLFQSDRVCPDQSFVPKTEIKYRYKRLLDIDNALPWARIAATNYNPKGNYSIGKYREA